jgi:hypothetical protein
MKIVRYQTKAGEVLYGALRPDGSANEIKGDIFGAFEVTGKKAELHKLLAPIAPVNLLCIGRHPAVSHSLYQSNHGRAESRGSNRFAPAFEQ